MNSGTAIIAIAAFLLASSPAGAAEPLGLWITNEGKARVLLEACEDERLCGAIVWLRQPLSSKGKPLADGNNTDPKLRKRPIIGLPVVLAMTRSGAATWQGSVYSPEKGKAYEVELNQVSDVRIEITGCGLMGLICETHVWERARDEAP